MFGRDNTKIDNDAKLSILENAIKVVDKNKTSLGKVKNMS
jgi:hypothetical protein